MRVLSASEVLACLAAIAGAAACASQADPMRYRLGGSGAHWADAGDGSVIAELRERYPEFFELVLDPATTRDPDMRPVRRDLEHAPVDRRNFDALNSVAVAYFELNYRAEADRGGGSYLGASFRTAHLLAVPWRAYSEIEDPALRDAILDFFEDAGSGEKLGTASTTSRLASIVASLEQKEPDPARRERIQRLTASLRENNGLEAQE
jgi:hypothetical protein